MPLKYSDDSIYHSPGESIRDWLRRRTGESKQSGDKEGVWGYYFKNKKQLQEFKYQITILNPLEQGVFKTIGERIQKDEILDKLEIEKMFKKEFGDMQTVKNRLNKILLNFVKDKALSFGFVEKNTGIGDFWKRVTRTENPEKRIEMLQDAGFIRKEKSQGAKTARSFIDSLAERSEMPKKDELLESIKSLGIKEDEFESRVIAVIADAASSNEKLVKRIEGWKSKLNEPQYALPTHQQTLKEFISDDNAEIAKNTAKISKAEEVLGILKN